MPNWTENHVHIKFGKEKDVEDFRAFIRSDDLEFDFNKIVPMPPELEIEASSSVDDAIILLTNDTESMKNMLSWGWVASDGIKTIEGVRKALQERTSEKAMELGKQALENIKKYGCKNWYEWHNKYWGTKWNACDLVLGPHKTEKELRYRFNTAWCHPEPIFLALSAKFPTARIKVLYIDEDYDGDHTVSYLGGELVEEF